MTAIGRSLLRVEDGPLLTGAVTYSGDIPRDGLVEVVFVRSTLAHARVLGIDTAAARDMPGVVGVYTRDDFADIPRYSTVAGMPEEIWRPVLAEDVVRYVGEPVAMVAATSLAEALDAAEQVVVDYEPLPVVVDVDEAAAAEAPAVTRSGSNIAVTLPATAPDEAVFAQAAVVLEATFDNQRIAVAPLEGNVLLAEPVGDRLLVHASSQAPHLVRNMLAPLVGLRTDQVDLVSPATGGGFGAKSVSEHEMTVVAALALRLGRPVRWKQTRSENLATSHGRAQRQRVRLAADEEGRLLALHADIIGDGGGYPAVGAYLPMLTQRMLAGVYAVPAVSSTACAIATNTSPTTAFRGAGRPEAACLVERAIDIVAAELGIDPVEIRRRNFVSQDAFPYTTPTGAVYDSGDYAAALDKVLELAGYDALRAEQAARRARGDRQLLGIGVAVYVEASAGAGPSEFADIEVHADGSATVRVGTFGHGQGHRTTMAQIAADVLLVPVERIRVIDGDTRLVARGEGTYSSRSVQVGGTTVHLCAQQVVARARAFAAALLEANPEDIVLDATGFSVAGVPARTIGWTDVVAVAERERPADQPAWRALAEQTDWTRPSATFPFGAHVAVVEVDADTGKVTLVRHVAVDDCGTIINPLLATGQVHGGVAQGVAQALFEAVRYDADGNLLTGSFLDYAVPSAAELPFFETDHTVTPTPVNPLGAKGIGESGTTGATPAVNNAVVDALAHLGVRHLEMPCTPERVWQAITTGESEGALRITRQG